MPRTLLYWKPRRANTLRLRLAATCHASGGARLASNTPAWTTSCLRLRGQPGRPARSATQERFLRPTTLVTLRPQGLTCLTPQDHDHRFAHKAMRRRTSGYLVAFQSIYDQACVKSV